MKNTLTAWQLFSLYFLFELGTSVIFGFGGGGNQDAWLATGISSVSGIGLIWLYTKLLEWHPDKNWIALMVHLFGRYAGNLLASLYIGCMIYDAGRDMRDFGELMHTYLLPKTPLIVVMFLLSLIVVYGCAVGLTRIGRFAELLLPVVIFILVLEFVLLTATGIYDFKLLTPVAADWGAIAKTVFPVGITVPFGESLSFALFWAMTAGPGSFRKSVLLASVSVGAVLVMLDLAAIATSSRRACRGSGWFTSIIRLIPCPENSTVKSSRRKCMFRLRCGRYSSTRRLPAASPSPPLSRRDRTER